MLHIAREIFDLSEVWALTIPITQLILKPKQPSFLRPVILYLLLALALNLTCDFLSEYNKMHRGDEISNNPIYNLHSVLRFFCFSYFFISLKQKFYKSLDRILPLLYLVAVVINLTTSQGIFYKYNISGNLFTIEAFFLLCYCMLYYLSQLKAEVKEMRHSKDFLVVTGLAIYVVVNFFVFLFYVPLIKENAMLANNMWDVHNSAYIILCTFIAKALYAPLRS